MEAHKVASLFPLMTQGELKALAADIEKNGQVEPIVTWQGLLLDGRNRLAACKLAKVEPMVEALKKLPADGLVGYVISKNLKRRHLKAVQRARVGAQAKALLQEEAAERKRAAGEHGKKGGRGNRNPAPPKGGEGLRRKSGESVRQAAKAVGVGKNAVEAMVAVEKKAPEVAAAVDDGVIETVADAKRVAALPTEEARQQAIELISKGKDAVEACDIVDERLAEQKGIERAVTKAAKLVRDVGRMAASLSNMVLDLEGVLDTLGDPKAHGIAVVEVRAAVTECAAAMQRIAKKLGGK